MHWNKICKGIFIFIIALCTSVWHEAISQTHEVTVNNFGNIGKGIPRDLSNKPLSVAVIFDTASGKFYYLDFTPGGGEISGSRIHKTFPKDIYGNPVSVLSTYDPVTGKFYYWDGGTSVALDSGDLIVDTDTLLNSGFVHSNLPTSYIQYDNYIYSPQLGEFIISDPLFINWGRGNILIDELAETILNSAYMGNYGKGINIFGGNVVPANIGDDSKMSFVGMYSSSPTSVNLYGKKVNYLTGIGIYPNQQNQFNFGQGDTVTIINSTANSVDEDEVAKSVAINFSRIGKRSYDETDKARFLLSMNNSAAEGQSSVAINGAKVYGVGSVAIGAGQGNGLSYDDYGALGKTISANYSSVIAIGSGDIGDYIRDNEYAYTHEIGLNVSVGFDNSVYRPGAQAWGNGHHSDAPYTISFGNGAYGRNPGSISFSNMTYQSIVNGDGWDSKQTDDWSYFRGDLAAGETDTIKILGIGDNQKTIEGWTPSYGMYKGEAAYVTAYITATSQKSRKTAIYKFEFVFRSVDHAVLPDSIQILGLEKKTLYNNSDMDISPLLGQSSYPELMWLATGDSTEPTRWAIKMEVKSTYL